MKGGSMEGSQARAVELKSKELGTTYCRDAGFYSKCDGKPREEAGNMNSNRQNGRSKTRKQFQEGSSVGHDICGAEGEK